MSESHKGKKLSESHVENMKNDIRGTPKKKVKCPHCGKIGGQPTMKRWHFENCKYKRDVK